MPYISKADFDEILRKAKKSLDYFAINHYYKVPHEKDIIQNVKDIVSSLEKNNSKGV